MFFIAVSVLALPPDHATMIKKQYDLSEFDSDSYIDANNILMFVNNRGSIGYDYSAHFGRVEGYYYPFSGDTMSIINDEFEGTLMYCSGITLVGKVNGEIRAAVPAYDVPEFRPGPMSGGTFLPDDPSFRVYKIDTMSGPGDPDYDEWPVSQGAPVDEMGNPLLMGNQTLWTVYNDADPDFHNSFMGGGTSPLGIEVQQTVWGSKDSLENNVLYLQYKLHNRGENVIDSFYISFWADPDIGGANDDFTGCDTVNDIFFCYQGDNSDSQYGFETPAWGGKVLAGPVIASPGDTAAFNGGVLPGYRNLKMSSYIGYVSGEEPSDPQELFLYAQGKDGKTGEPLINPISGEQSKYFAPGNPFQRVDWVDLNPADKKIMVNWGPLQFNPGDSQQVLLKLGSYVEENRLFSLSYLRYLLDNTIKVDSAFDTLQYFPAYDAEVTVSNYGLSSVVFSPFKEQWIDGFSGAPGSFFNNGAGYALTFPGSRLDPEVDPEEFHPVMIRFSNQLTQKAYRYVWGEVPNFAYSGYEEVPFTVWDLDNDRQLNAAFVERIGTAVYDGTWSPDYTEFSGGYEYLFIFASDYSGDDPENSDIPYTILNIMEDAYDFDMLYFLWPVLRDGSSMSDLRDGHNIIFSGQFYNLNGRRDTLYFRTTAVNHVHTQAIEVTSYGPGPSKLLLSSSATSAFYPSTGLLKFTGNESMRLVVYFAPLSEGFYNEELYVIDSLSGDTLDRVQLVAQTLLATDVDDNENELLPDNFALSQNYPNPFNASTIIEFELPRKSEVELDIFNILGQKVKNLISETLGPGRHITQWDSRDAKGREVASGVYFYRLKIGDHAETKKMQLIK